MTVNQFKQNEAFRLVFSFGCRFSFFLFEIGRRNNGERSLCVDKFLSVTKNTVFFLFKYIWVVFLVLVVNYFIYQNSFSWSHSDEKEATNTLKSNEDVIFIVVEEDYSGVKGNEFDSLSESLQTWAFDERHKKFYLKYEKLLPYVKTGEETYYDNTKVILLYDRGFDSFERYSEVVSIATFPYKYYFNKKPFIAITSIDEDGTVFLEYKDKRIQLKPEERYSTRAVNGFQLSKTTIKNHGVYKKDQFLPFKEAKEKAKNTKKNGKQTGNQPSDAPGLEEVDAPKKLELPNIHQ